MLGGADVHATIPVADLGVAKSFYGDTLQLVKLDEKPGLVAYQSGSGKLFVYESDFAGTNHGTAVAWDVKDVETMIAVLKEKGVTFEHYDLPGVSRQGDVHLMPRLGGAKAAWFKDPFGNILCIGTAL